MQTFYIQDGAEDKRQNRAFRQFQGDALRQGRAIDEFSTREATDNGILKNRQVLDDLFTDLATQTDPHLVLYFHGGLVRADDARHDAIPFGAKLQEAGMTPLFWIWHSDATTELGDAWRTFQRTFTANLGAGLRYLWDKTATLFRSHPRPAWWRYLRRHQQGTAPHPYAAAIEEWVRGTPIGNSIAALWEEMKEDITDAFQSHQVELRAGTYFLDKLQAALTTPAHPPLKVSLIGHSGGANYICALLQAAATRQMNVIFDHIIFWAPGVTFQTFHDAIVAHPHRFGAFHLFGMTDPHERVDAIRDPYLGLPLYPQSLIYFVSGLLEGGCVTPLVGLQHYVESDGVRSWARTPFDTPMHQAVRAFLNSAGCSHWLSTLHHHGGFVKDYSQDGVVVRTLGVLGSESSSVATIRWGDGIVPRPKGTGL